MSTSAPQTQEEIQEEARRQIHLNDRQIDAVIAYAVQNGMYDGQPPTDPELKRTDAATLVYQARRARDNGNQTQHVTELCFIGDVDANPPIADAPAPSAETSQGNGGAPEPPAAPVPPEFDITKKSDEELKAIIAGLEPQKEIPAVASELERVRTEQLRRQSSAATQEEVPPPAQAPTPPSAQAPLPPEQSPPSGAEGDVGFRVGGTLPEGATDASGQLRPRADAPADTTSEAPQPSAEAQGTAQAGSDAKARRRVELEAGMTGKILVAYDKTFADVAELSDEELEHMIAHPEGTSSAPASEAPAQPPISTERAKLEEQVTGPMLKAWKRGRRDVVDLSDADLKLMVDNPTGPPSQSQQAVAAAVPPSIPSSATEPPAAVPNASTSESWIPVPPDIENPPQLAFDISKLSDVDLRSTHGQFHAVLARANWVIATRRDHIDDLEQALSFREVEVENGLPATIDGKKITKDLAAAQVAGDEEVQRLQIEIKDARKDLRKLEVVAENARSTVARCSREFSMRHGEEFPERGGTP